MLLLGLAVILVTLGLAAFVAEPGNRRRTEQLVSTAGLCLVIFGLLWVTGLLLPLPMSWLTAAVGAFVMIFVKARQGSAPVILMYVASLGLAALAFHFTLTLLDLILSTRQIASDWALLLAALERSTAVSELVPVVGLIALLVLSACLGQWFGIRSRRGQLRDA